MFVGSTLLMECKAAAAAAAEQQGRQWGARGQRPMQMTPEQRANASFVWGDTIDVTRAVDLFMINHESTFAGVADKDPATIQFEDPLNYTHAYAAAGVGFVSLANNHQYDFGFGGLNKTLAALSGLGVPVAGWPQRSAAAVRRPRVVALPDGGPKVAVFTLVVDECYKWPNGTTYLAGCTCGANADPAATPDQKRLGDMEVSQGGGFTLASLSEGRPKKKKTAWSSSVSAPTKAVPLP